MGHRMPRMCPRVSSAVSTGAWHRERFNSCVSTCRRSTNQTAGPGHVSRTATTRTAAHSAIMGPWLPSLIVWRVHASAGSVPATSRPAAPTPRREVGGRALLPDSRGVGHFGTIPQAQPRDAIQTARVAPTRLVRHDPPTPQHLALDHCREHLLRQLGLGCERGLGRKAALPAPFRIGVVGEPCRGHRPPTVQHRGALGTDIADKHTGLAVGPLAQFPAGLTLHAYRMDALFWEITPIDHQHPSGGTQVRFHCLPVLLYQPLIVPLPCADKGLHGPYRLGSDTVHCQHHRLDRLAWQRRQHPLERGVRRFPLFPSLKEGTVDGMRGTQLLHQVFNILDRHVHLWCRLDPCGHAALLPLMAQGQYDTTFRILVVVLGKRLEGGMWGGNPIKGQFLGGEGTLDSWDWAHHAS